MVLKIKQKILNPANRTLQEGRLPASLRQLVPPSCHLLQPSGAHRAPYHVEAFAQASTSAGQLFPTLHLATFQVLSSEPFPESPGCTKLLCFPHLHLVCVMFHILSLGSFNTCFSHKLLDGRRPRYLPVHQCVLSAPHTEKLD